MLKLNNEIYIIVLTDSFESKKDISVCIKVVPDSEKHSEKTYIFPYLLSHPLDKSKEKNVGI